MALGMDQYNIGMKLTIMVSKFLYFSRIITMNSLQNYQYLHVMMASQYISFYFFIIRTPRKLTRGHQLSQKVPKKDQADCKICFALIARKSQVSQKIFSESANYSTAENHCNAIRL
jgi:hypothetical protein